MPMIFENYWPAIIGILSFLIFVALIHADRYSRFFISHFPSRGSAARVFMDRISGFVFMGFFPFIYLSVTHTQDVLYSLTLKQPPKETLPFFFLVITLIIIITAFYSGHEDNTRNYPQIRHKSWSVSLIFLNILTWTLYLAGYEFLFRGILIFTLLPSLGLPATVLINAAIYSFAHFYKGRKEMIAAIPFGLLLAYVTATTQSLWFAFFFHITLALSNDFFSARALHYRIDLRRGNENR